MWWILVHHLSQNRSPSEPRQVLFVSSYRAPFGLYRWEPLHWKVWVPGIWPFFRLTGRLLVFVPSRAHVISIIGWCFQTCIMLHCYILNSSQGKVQSQSSGDGCRLKPPTQPGENLQAVLQNLDLPLLQRLSSSKALRITGLGCGCTQDMAILMGNMKRQNKDFAELLDNCLLVYFWDNWVWGCVG